MECRVKYIFTVDEKLGIALRAALSAFHYDSTEPIGEHLNFDEEEINGLVDLCDYLPQRPIKDIHKDAGLDE